MNQTISGTSNIKRKRDNLNSVESIYIAMLSVIPGMSKNKAETLFARFPTIKLLSEANESEIAELKCNTRKIGPILAKVIFTTFNN